MQSEHLHVRPAGELRRYIAFYSCYRLRGGVPATHRGLPSPYLTVIFTLDEPLTVLRHPDPAQPAATWGALIGGLHTRPALIGHDGSQSGIQVAMTPLGSRLLLGLPAGELASLDVDATDILGRPATELGDRLRAAPSWAARVALLERHFLAAAAAAQADGRDAGADPRLVGAWAMLRAPGARVGDVARAVGWSPRTMDGWFRREIGLSPKQAARVARFDRARRALQRAAPPAGRLADIAQRLGYADQAHLSREFGQFAGASPLRWLRSESASGADSFKTSAAD
jgi:AraC-like DNA-binding protein